MGFTEAMDAMTPIVTAVGVIFTSGMAISGMANSAKAAEIDRRENDYMDKVLVPYMSRYFETKDRETAYLELKKVNPFDVYIPPYLRELLVSTEPDYEQIHQNMVVDYTEILDPGRKNTRRNRAVGGAIGKLFQVLASIIGVAGSLLCLVVILANVAMEDPKVSITVTYLVLLAASAAIGFYGIRSLMIPRVDMYANSAKNLANRRKTLSAKYMKCILSNPIPNLYV